MTREFGDTKTYACCGPKGPHMLASDEVVEAIMFTRYPDSHGLGAYIANFRIAWFHKL